MADRSDPTVRFVSGWGETEEEARNRCLHEAAERYSAQLFGNEPLRRACRTQLGNAIAPSELLLIDDSQYRQRRAWNAAHPGLNALPHRWIDTARIDWIRADPALSSEEAWVAAGLCFLGHRRDRRAGLPPADSNGIGAGANVEDAVVRAFLELLERDAVAIWWYNRVQRPRIDPDTARSELVEAYAAWSRQRGRMFGLIDVTHDFDIPVVVAVSHAPDGSAVAFGFGVGGQLAIACRHAVGELAQFESNLALIERRVACHGQSGLTPEARALLDWYWTACLADHPQLVAVSQRTTSRKTEGLDLVTCRRLCTERGFRFMVLNLVRPGIDVAVVRVLVPGLRPMWARFAPGRLFDVPVRLGWRKSPATPSDLNPVPLMF